MTAFSPVASVLFDVPLFALLGAFVAAAGTMMGAVGLVVGVRRLQGIGGGLLFVGLVAYLLF